MCTLNEFTWLSKVAQRIIPHHPTIESQEVTCLVWFIQHLHLMLQSHILIWEGEIPERGKKTKQFRPCQQMITIWKLLRIFQWTMQQIEVLNSVTVNIWIRQTSFSLFHPVNLRNLDLSSIARWLVSYDTLLERMPLWCWYNGVKGKVCSWVNFGY